jgi:hypothetical protein
MKVVLDSNVLLVALGKRSRYKPIWNAFAAKPGTGGIIVF